MSNSLWTHGLQHTRLPCPSPSPGVCSNSCPLSWWCHPSISYSVVPFSSCLQSFPASGSFPMSRLFDQVTKILELEYCTYILRNTIGWIGTANNMISYFLLWFEVDHLCVKVERRQVLSRVRNSWWGGWGRREEFTLSSTSSLKITDMASHSASVLSNTVATCHMCEVRALEMC